MPSWKWGSTWKRSPPNTQNFLATNRMSVIDTAVLVHQVPGGMISNLVSQLKEAKALHRLNEVYAEVPITRKELGTPPLVTPTSQIVGVQAVMNVLFGKYKMITNQVKDLVYGLYGKTPTPIDPEIQKIVLKNYKRGQTPVTGRAGRLSGAGTGRGQKKDRGLGQG